MTPVLTALGIEVHRALFPPDMDANDLLVQGTDLGAIVNNAEWTAHGQHREPDPEVAPLPSPPVAVTENEPPVEIAPADEAVMMQGDRRWRVRGLDGNTGPETMRVNIMVSRQDVGLHVDSFDLYSHRHRAGFIKQAAIEVGVEERVIKGDVGKVLMHLEELQERLFKQQKHATNEPFKLTKADETEALELLRSPGLIDRIVDDLTATGLVGEATNLSDPLEFCSV